MQSPLPIFAPFYCSATYLYQNIGSRVRERSTATDTCTEGLFADVFRHSYAERRISLAVEIPRELPLGYFTDSLNISREYISRQPKVGAAKELWRVVAMLRTPSGISESWGILPRVAIRISNVKISGTLPILALTSSPWLLTLPFFVNIGFRSSLRSTGAWIFMVLVALVVFLKVLGKIWIL